MAIALPFSRGIFSHIQEDLRHVDGERVELIRGFHQALAYSKCLDEDLGREPPQMY